MNNNTENIRFIKEVIYNIITYSLFDYIGSALTLMKLKMKPGQEAELCCMFLDLCFKPNLYSEHIGRLGHVTQVKFQLNHH